MATERWMRMTMGAVFLAAAAYLLYILRFVLVTVLLAAILAYAILPMVEWTARLRIAGNPLPRLTAVIAVFALIALALGGTGRLAATPIGDELNRFARNVGQYRSELATLLLHIRTSLEQNLPSDVRQNVEEALTRRRTSRGCPEQHGSSHHQVALPHC